MAVKLFYTSVKQDAVAFAEKCKTDGTLIQDLKRIETEECEYMYLVLYREEGGVEPIGKVKEPKILPEDNTITYNEKVTITLVPDNPKDKIKYKLSKTEENFIDYTYPFEIKENNTEEDGEKFTEVFAKATRDGMDDSEVVSKKYKISKGKIPNPVIDKKSGGFDDKIVLNIETVEDTEVYYSFNSRTDLDLLYDKNKKITLPDDGVKNNDGFYDLYFQAKGKDGAKSDVLKESYSFEIRIEFNPKVNTHFYEEEENIVKLISSFKEAKIFAEIGTQEELKDVDITSNSTEYPADGLKITPDKNSIKTRAFYKNDEVKSQLISASYVFKVKDPIITESGDGLSIEITCETNNSIIYYSEESVDPNFENPNLYSGPIRKIDLIDSNNIIILSKAKKDGFEDSNIVRKNL